MKTRNYKNADAQMTATSRTIRQLFSDDLADFTAFDTTLDNAFLADWLLKIEAAETVVRDSTLLDIQVQLTNQVNELMEDARDKFYDVRYFVKKAFPKKVEVLNEFGANDFGKDRNSQPRMVQFLDGLHKAADKYKTQLTNKGLDQTEIDEILTLRTALSDANTAQEAMKRGRPVLTDDRIEVLNACYDATKTVIDAAQRVYKDDAAKRHAYRYDDAGNGNGENEITFSGTVTDNETGAVIEGATLEANGEVVATTNAAGAFTKTFTITEVLSIQLIIKKTGYDDYGTPVQFSPGTDLEQNYTIPRKVITTYQQIIGMGMTTLGNTPASATGLRVRIMSGDGVTVGYSSNAMTFSGTPFSVNAIGQIVDRQNAELGGYNLYIMAENNTAGSVEVRVDVLG